MTTFQLDQNSNHRRFAAQCNADGHCIVKRLPRELTDEDDSVILTTILPSGATLLSMDFALVCNNGQHVIANNWGVIIVKARPNTHELMTNMVRRFKSKFPKWWETDWRRIYMEIEENEIYASILIDGNVDNGRTVSFADEDFAASLESCLTALREEGEALLAVHEEERSKPTLGQISD